MGSDQHYSLRWNDYTVKIVTAFQHLRDEEDFVDVTVACDGHSYAAHKMVLSACSPYFRTLLRANPCQHPIVILKDVGHTEMERLLEFMYNGEVNIAQDQLGAFLKTAENLKIRGLAGSSDESDQMFFQNHTKDLSHSFSSTYGGGQSGRSSPSAGYAPSQGSKDDEIIQDGQGSHARPDSPPSKRRKRSNMAALGQTDVNTSSQSADGVTEESGQSDIVSAGQLGSEDDQRTDRREMKSEPGDSMTDIYSESSDLSIDPQQVPHGDGLDPRQSVMYPLAIPGPSGSAGATDTVPAGSHEPGGLRVEHQQPPPTRIKEEPQDPPEEVAPLWELDRKGEEDGGGEVHSRRRWNATASSAGATAFMTSEAQSHIPTAASVAASTDMAMAPPLDIPSTLSHNHHDRSGAPLDHLESLVLVSNFGPDATGLPSQLVDIVGGSGSITSTTWQQDLPSGTMRVPGAAAVTATSVGSVDGFRTATWYACTTCGKQFRTRVTLSRHEKIHTGKAFTCPHCPKVFYQVSNIKYHVRAVHGTTYEYTASHTSTTSSQQPHHYHQQQLQLQQQQQQQQQQPPTTSRNENCPS
ncbi:uncharacterized protein LOC143018520 isoform X6 [Oratosquilla oratoria]|uniref:uncharacterized protein LOC143018520 isoform X6 n=1 Tax=Oratosquilla oratoria TaxID=337810 RepID=UPI003F776482